ncbi:MAG: hypothetical protein R2733_03720 [Acidimicrobiales bacterium]
MNTSLANHGFRATRAVAVALLMLAGVVFGIGSSVAPVGAELASLPTTTWGVSGLQTGTETDNIDAPIFDMARIGNVLYVGGRFTDVTDGVATVAQSSLAAFDATTGEWIPTFTPSFDGAVYALEASPDGSRLFVGGDFTTVNGTSTGALIALDPATGAIDTGWSGRVGGYQLVRDFDIDGTQLYAAGGFTSISSSAGGNVANRVARFDLTTGAHDPSWRPVLSNGSVWGIDVSPSAGRVYAVGTIKMANGSPIVGGFVSLELSDGTNTVGVEPLQVNATSIYNQYAYDVLAVNGKVFVAGSQYYLQVLNESDLSLETFHLSKYRGDYQVLELVGDRVYAGCHCRQDTILASADGVMWAGTPPVGETNAVPFAQSPNSWVSAFDATTGLHIISFRPDINSSGSGLWAIQDDGNGCLWLGGALISTNNVTQYAMTRLCDTSSFDFVRPSTPGAAQVTNIGVDSVDLVWGASTDAVGVEGYRIYDSTTNAVLLDALTESGTIIELAPGTYTVYVKAYDAAGNISWRSGFTTFTVTGIPVDTERPSTPGSPSIVSNVNGTVVLDWTPSTDNIGVAGYTLYDSATNAVVSTSATASLTLTGLADGTYSYYLKAFDEAGNISWRSGSRSVTVVTGPPPDTQRPTVPGAPNVVSNIDDTVELDWTPSTDNVGVAGYTLYDAATNAVVATSPSETLTLTGLTDGTYSYYLKAFDAAGNTSWKSGNRSVTVVNTPAPDIEAPTAPSDLTAITIGVDSVDLEWLASTDNVAVAGYQIVDPLTDTVLLDVVSVSGTITGLAPGSYDFVVRAYDAAGNVSVASAVLTVVIV